VFDLLNLNKNSEGLRIRWNKDTQFNVENLFLFECASDEDAIHYFNKGLQNKVVASHKLNHASSRSHCIFTLNFEMIDASTDVVISSRLTLVDLAGSERVGVHGTTGVSQKESIDIN
jgi:hypothetical protein